MFRLCQPTLLSIGVGCLFSGQELSRRDHTLIDKNGTMCSGFTFLSNRKHVLNINTDLREQLPVKSLLSNHNESTSK